MADVWQQAGPTIVVLGFMALLMLPSLFFVAPWRRRAQFHLGTFLLWVVTPAAVLAWITTWEGPYFSPRRVLTHKMGAIVMFCAIYVPAVAFRALKAEVKRRASDTRPSTRPETLATRHDSVAPPDARPD